MRNLSKNQAKNNYKSGARQKNKQYKDLTH